MVFRVNSGLVDGKKGGTDQEVSAGEGVSGRALQLKVNGGIEISH